MGKANPNRMNGVNKVVYQLATRQVREGQKVQVWGFTHDLTVNYAERNFTTVLFRTPNRLAGLGADFLLALKSLSATETIFHLHGGWVLPFFKAARALKNAGLRYVVTGHGAYNTIAMKKSKWVKKAYFQLFEKALLKNASAIHCIGASEVTGVKKILNTNRTVLIPYGMEFSGPKPTEAQPRESFIFGFLGRLDYHTKGLDLMLEAFAAQFRNNEAVSLWLVGDGAGRAAVTTLIEELGISGNVVLWGARFGEEKDALLQQMSVFLHPSRNEGLPSAVLEAAALGLPCIVTDATNVGDYVNRHQAGFVVANEDASALGKAMKQTQLLAPRALKEMGTNAENMVVSGFNWPHIVKQFNQLYA